MHKPEYIESKVPNWRIVQDHLAREGKISKELFVKMINDTMDIFSKLTYLIPYLRE